MTRGTKWLAAGFALAASTVFAADATEPNALARQQLMDTIGAQVGVLGGMAQGKVDYDATAAAAAKEALIAASGEIVAKFQTESTDPKSKALPVIWTAFPDFTAKSEALTAAATAMDVSSLDGIKAGMAGVGASCSGCHGAYRAK